MLITVIQYYRNNTLKKHVYTYGRPGCGVIALFAFFINSHLFSLSAHLKLCYSLNVTHQLPLYIWHANS